MSFKITAKEGNARAGELTTNHGVLKTPFFMPVATKATGKLISSDDYNRMNSQCIISNAFILSLKPGTDLIKKHGGLHKFMNYKGSIFTDCGGFQMLRPTIMAGGTKSGIIFQDPFHNKKVTIGPEKIMDIEEDIGADVIMALDNVVHYGTSKEEIKTAMDLTHKWMKECKDYYKGNQLVFGITQGGTFPDLRKESSIAIDKLDFDGNAIGGLCIGEPKDKLYEMVKISNEYLSKDKPRYLMGVGSPEDIIKAVGMGIDIFDSIYPTISARHNTIFTWTGKIYINRAKHKENLGPLCKDCDCFVCKDFSRSYIWHLIKLNEPIVKRYVSYHNLYFMQRFMERIRKEIENNTFDKFAKEFTYFNRDN